MKRSIIIILTITGILFTGRNNLYGQSKPDQQTKVIRIDSLFRNYAVIFDSTYKLPIRIDDVKGRFTPSVDDVVLAERIFTTQYNETNQSTESRKGARVLTDAKRFFKNYNRQFIGYIDSNGDSNLVMHLFDYGKKKAVEKYTGGSWKNSLVILFAEKMPFTIITYRVNLKQQKLYGTIND